GASSERPASNGGSTRSPAWRMTSARRRWRCAGRGSASMPLPRRWVSARTTTFTEPGLPDGPPGRIPAGRASGLVCRVALAPGKRRAPVATTATDEIYYDPFDIEIDKDPHPLWKRMRDEAPLYHNDRYGFYALSR